MAKSPEPHARTMKNGDWNEILSSIERERCILVLGPGAFMDAEGNSLMDKLCEAFASELDTEVPDSADKLFQLADKLTEQRGWRKLISDITEEVYEQPDIHEIYSTLAQIPFHLILSTSPGLNLCKAFDSKGVPYHFDYYNYKEKHEPEVSFSSQQPLIFNLFGKLQDEDSLVLTHESLLDFIFSILSTKGFPQTIKEKVISATNFLYLGFDFESWYLKILLKLFESQELEVSYAHAWHIQRLRLNTREFFQKKFRIDFIDLDFVGFIKELYKRCGDENILREAGEAKEEESDFKKVAHMVKTEKIDEAIDFLEQYADNQDDTDFLRDVITISRRYNGLLGSKLKGTITEENAKVEMNQIVDGLLNLAEVLNEAA